MKSRLVEAALPLPKVAFAGQQSPAENARQGAIVRGLGEIRGVRDKHGLDVAWMRDQVYRNMSKAHANHVPVFLSASLVKPQPVAPNFDRTAQQESPLRPRGSSWESFRRGCSGHKFGLKPSGKQ